MKINNHWRAISRLGIRGLRCSNTVNQNRENKFSVDVSLDEAHWRRVRDVFVAAFHRYPLYEHIIPDKGKRPEFLRRYLDSVYHVSHRGEKSVLVTFSHLVSPSLTPFKSIIGGSLLLRPCFDGESWKNVCDEELAEAYVRFKLDELDVNAVSRLKSYEKWESDQITDKLQSAGVPTWDAMFYGIEPRLIGNGNGSNGFVDGVPVLYQLHREYEAEDCQNRNRLITCDPHNYLSGTNLDQGNVTPKTLSESAFLILGISHCPRAANFHRKNGMLQIATLPYQTCSGASPFDVYILYYDPFGTGKPEEIQKVFDKFPPH